MKYGRTAGSKSKLQTILSLLFQFRGSSWLALLKMEHKMVSELSFLLTQMFNFDFGERERDRERVKEVEWERERVKDVEREREREREIDLKKFFLNLEWKFAGRNIFQKYNLSNFTKAFPSTIFDCSDCRTVHLLN